VALANALYFLAANPKWWGPLQREVDQVLGDGTSSMDEGDSEKLRLCTQVINESLRLAPPAAVIARLIEKDVVLDGCRIPVAQNKLPPPPPPPSSDPSPFVRPLPLLCISPRLLSLFARAHLLTHAMLASLPAAILHTYSCNACIATCCHSARLLLQCLHRHQLPFCTLTPAMLASPPAAILHAYSCNACIATCYITTIDRDRNHPPCFQDPH
jgi:hypothetical protein